MAAYLTLLLAATSFLAVNASPAPYGFMAEFNIAKRDTSFPAAITPECVPFVIGSDGAASPTGSSGQVCLSVDPSAHTITVTYPTSPSGYSYVREHVWVGCSAPVPGRGGNIDNGPGNYPFTSGTGHCTQTAGGVSAQCTFNIDTILSGCKRCDSKFYIVAHASLTKTVGGTTTGATGAGSGTNFGGAWHRMSWNPTFQCLCTAVSTFAPSTYEYTYYDTKTIESTSTTSYITTSSTTITIITTSSSIYETTDYYPTTWITTSSTTSTSFSTPEPSTTISVCR